MFPSKLPVKLCLGEFMDFKENRFHVVSLTLEYFLCTIQHQCLVFWKATFIVGFLSPFCDLYIITAYIQPRKKTINNAPSPQYPLR